MNISPQIERAIERYLGSVDEHIGTMPFDERKDLPRELRSHIHQELDDLVQEGVAEIEDIEAVLAQMDPPESYAQHGNEQL